MTNHLLYSYYYRFREHRKQVKILVDSEDYQEARDKLEAAITEHENKYSESTKRDFNYGERLMMDHSKDHLDTVIDNNDPPFY